MPIPAEANRLANELTKSINNNPVDVTRFIHYTGDGHGASNSWQFTDSWKGRLDDINRNQWFTFTTDGSSSKRISNLTVPSSQFATPPAVGHRLTISVQGVSAGDFRINFVSGLTWRGHTYAYQLTLETSQ